MKLLSILLTSLSLIASTKALAEIPWLQQNNTSQLAPTIFGKFHLQNEIDTIVNSYPNAAVAIYIKSMKNGEALYARNIHHALMPASTLKVLTAEAALLYLGSQYRFATKIFTKAKTIYQGTLRDNLYIKLSGDPSLTYLDLLDLFQQLKAKGIKRIKGNIIIDSSDYDENFYGPGWAWKDKKYCYGAPISASIINHNCLSFHIIPAKIKGKTAKIVTSTQYFYPPIKNAVITKKTYTKHCSLHLSESLNKGLHIHGCMPKGHYAWAVNYVINDIKTYNLVMFKNLLHQTHITYTKKMYFGKTPSFLRPLAIHHSEPLQLLINEMLKKSDNVIAGAIFKKIGQLYTHKAGSWENGRFAVAHILAKRMKLGLQGMRVLDGSGLSPANLTTSAQLMQVLDFAYHHHLNFLSALPIAGIDGTLKHRLKEIATKVRAKTGTISGVTTLAGYAVSADQEPIAFVIMVNGHHKDHWHYKSLEDKIAIALTRYYAHFL